MGESYLEIVRETAARLRLLNKNGDLAPLDSLGIIELAVALERATSITIPIDRVERVAFRTLQSVATLLDGLAGAPRTGSG